MNILYLITGLGGGGAEKVVADLADQMVFLGHEVKIAYLKGGADGNHAIMPTVDSTNEYTFFNDYYSLRFVQQFAKLRLASFFATLVNSPDNLLIRLQKILPAPKPLLNSKL